MSTSFYGQEFTVKEKLQVRLMSKGSSGLDNGFTCVQKNSLYYKNCNWAAFLGVGTYPMT